MVWRGVAMQGNAGEARRGRDWQGVAGQGRQCEAGPGEAMHGEARRGRQGNAGKAWRGNAGLGAARQALQMATGKDPWQPGKTGYILTTTKGTKRRARNEKQKQNQARK